MTTITLQLEPAAAKFFRYHHDDVFNKPSMLRGHFKRLVLINAEVHPTGIIKHFDNLVQVSANVASEVKSYKIDSRTKALFIPEEKMRMLNDAFIALLEDEINNTVELFESMGKQHKHAFEYIISKYDLDGNDYSFDRMKKMNYRYRMRATTTK
jgi:hypothetical protein